MQLAVRDRSLDFRSVVINTERVRLQAISRKFTEEIYENFTPKITQYMMPAPPAERADAAAFVDSALLGLDRRDDLHLVICLHDGGEFLGICGLYARGQPNEPELGIWLKKAAHGHGYGLEAITALKKWAESQLEYERLLFPVDRRNTPSRRIPEALGGRIITEKKITSMSGAELDIVIFGIDRQAPSGT
jgi:RimJ/RimL family protein N-acetyltransferase